MMNKLKVLFLVLLVFGANCIFASPILLDKVVAVVNNSVITESAVDRAMVGARQQLKSSNTPIPSQRELQKQILDNLIDQELMRQMVVNTGIKVSDSELNAAILNIAKQNRMTLQQLKNDVEASGLSYAKYRNQFRKQMAISKLERQEVGQNIKVTDQEVNAFMQKIKYMHNPNASYHLEDILIELPDTPSPKQIQQAKQRAEDLVQQAKQGKNFRGLAAAHSGGKQAMKGGDLGWRRLAEMPTIFAGSVKNMKVGQFVGPLRAPNGFHVIKLVGVRDSKQKLTKNQVRGLIFQRKFEEQIQPWLQRLREEAYVKIL